MADSYFSRSSRLPRAYLEAVVSEAIAASDEQYGIDAAVAWAGGFTFPRAMLLSDMKCFQAAQLDLSSGDGTPEIKNLIRRQAK